VAATQVLDREPSERGWHIGVGIPRSAPFMHASLVANPIIEQAAAAILGPEPFLSFCNANTNATCSGSGERGEGSDTQALHGDGPWAFASAAEAAEAGYSWPHTATSIVVNFGTESITAGGGATEIWPGSHLVQEGNPWRRANQPLHPTTEELSAGPGNR
jgi:hypothetical protein